jgi:hypothetical protein
LLALSSELKQTASANRTALETLVSSDLRIDAAYRALIAQTVAEAIDRIYANNAVSGSWTRGHPTKA